MLMVTSAFLSQHQPTIIRYPLTQLPVTQAMLSQNMVDKKREEMEEDAIVSAWPLGRPLERYRIAPTFKANDPDTWDPDTPPFEVLRHFGSGNLEVDKFHQALKKCSIVTLKQLKDKREELEPLLSGNTWLLNEAIEGALRRVSTKPEDILGGLLFYDDRCIDSDAFHRYSRDAVSVCPDGLLKSPCDSLVTGPSGSGKTVFALRHLTECIYWFARPPQIIKIHFRAEDLVALMTRSSLGLGEAVVSVVQKQIDSELLRFGVEPVAKVNLRLHVIIDDAGGELYHSYFGGRAKLPRIVSCLESMTNYKFDRVHVTLVGTSLEVNTFKEFVEGKWFETHHFQMQPWSQSNFHALVDASFAPNRELVKAVVDDSSILKHLSCNARCASYLLESIHRASYAKTDKDLLKSMTNHFVSEVAGNYISNSPVGKLENKTEKWAVVSSVLRMLDKSYTQRDIAFFPRITGLTSERLRSSALSLLDVHIVSDENGKPTLPFDRYSASIELALTIVMVELLHQEKPISWDTFGVEFVVMLEEWKKMVAQWHELSSKANPLMLQFDCPFPTSAGKSEFILPMVTNNVVVQNRPDALYADVVAPYRLARAMFAEGCEIIEVDLEEELDQLGLLKSSKDVVQQAATSIMHSMWETWKDGVSPNDVAPVKPSDGEIPPGHHPPSSQEAPNAVVCRLDIENGLVTFGNKDDPGHLHQTIPVLKMFDETGPVAAVFVTNCDKFELKLDEDTVVPVTRPDVDREGRLKVTRLPAAFLANLRENVNIRFLFQSNIETS